MNSYTDWSKNDVILIQGWKVWNQKIVPTSLEQIKEDTYQIGYDRVDLPSYDSEGWRIQAGSDLDTYYKKHYQKWSSIGRCFMIIPKGSVDFNKRIIVVRSDGTVDSDSHEQPLEGEE
jgi:dUTPase